MFPVILVLLSIASMFACHVIAHRRGADPVFWGVLGLVFGPLAVPAAFFAKTKTGS